jgi:hypothetical protein
MGNSESGLDDASVHRSPAPALASIPEGSQDADEDWAANVENHGDFTNQPQQQRQQRPPKRLARGVEPIFSDEEHSDDDPTTEDDDSMYMMEASAAVFHYLEQAESGELEDISVADRSAAVFEYLEAEAQKGNEQPMVQFLETATVVSAVLMDDNHSVSEASAQVFKFLEDDASVSERSAAVFQLLEYTKLKYHHNPPNDNDDNNEDAQSVVSEKSAAIFKLLDDAKSVDARSVSEFSSAIFKLLEETKSCDGRSVSERSAAVFSMLDQQQQAISPAMSPKSQTPTLHHRNHQQQQQQPTTIHSQRSMNLPNTIMEERNNNNNNNDESSTVYSGMTPPQQMMSEEFHADSDYVSACGDNEEDEDDIDLVFVEHFDTAFNEFIGQHPQFLMTNPDLVHNLRITKLQKLLEHMDTYERAILTEMAVLKGEKQGMEELFQPKLREASRKKAARQINLQSDLTQLSNSTKVMQAKWTWKLVDNSESRAKKQYQWRQSYKQKVAATDSRQDLITMVPDGQDGQVLRDAVNALANSSSSSSSSSSLLSVEQQETDVRQFQVDNAFMNAELNVLKKKLAYQQIAAKKQAWVESILLRMDATTMGKLKAKYLKKIGVSNI